MPLYSPGFESQLIYQILAKLQYPSPVQFGGCFCFSSSVGISVKMGPSEGSLGCELSSSHGLIPN